MLQQFTLLDAVLAIVILLYVIAGISKGFFISLGTLAGFIAGVAAAVIVAPWAATQVPDNWYIFAIVIAVIVCLSLGQWLGFLVGRWMRSVSDRTPLKTVERLLGGLLNFVIAVLLIVVLSLTLKPLGMPAVSHALSDSKIVSTLERNVPQSWKNTINGVRNDVLTDARIPEITSLMYPQAQAPTQQLENAALEQASQSVVQILGAAEQCGYTSEGSGFVIDDALVATNAHVVAGVTEPVVQDREGNTYQGTVVYANQAQDIAFIRINEDFSLTPLPLGQEVASGTDVSFMGYPAGGPFDARPATVQGLGYSRTVDSTTGRENPSRLVYQLAAHVEQGNSGGPVLDENGVVVAQIFAKSTEGESGYAIPASVISDALTAAQGLTQPFDTGQCTAH